MIVKVQAEDFNPQAEVDAFPPAAIQGAGGQVTFVGLVRDYSEASDILAMEIEHYPGMTERELQRVCDEARQRYDVLDSLVIHRHGRLLPTDRIVQVTVWARHRAAAFDACRYIIDELKTRAPFWKKEVTPAGQRWVTDCPGCRAGSHGHGHTHLGPAHRHRAGGEG